MAQQNSFWADVRGTAVTTIVGTVLTGILYAAWEPVREKLSHSVTVPVWVVLSAALAAYMLYRYGKWRGTRARLGPEKPEYHRYVADLIDGVVWRWNWNESGQIRNMIACCPTCDLELVAEEVLGGWSPGLRGKSKTAFSCKKCSARAATVDGTSHENEASVRKEIARKIRTGEWKEAARIHS